MQFSVVTSSRAKDFFEVRALSISNMNPPEYRGVGEYKFTIAVSGEGTATAEGAIKIIWNGQWGQIEASLL